MRFIDDLLRNRVVRVKLIKNILVAKIMRTGFEKKFQQRLLIKNILRKRFYLLKLHSFLRMGAMKLELLAAEKYAAIVLLKK